MNPMTVARNVAARRLAEASTPVYSTATQPAPKREHVVAVEIENDMGNRRWSHMKESQVSAFVAEELEIGSSLSDQDHSAKCWCS